MPDHEVILGGSINADGDASAAMQQGYAHFHPEPIKAPRPWHPEGTVLRYEFDGANDVKVIADYGNGTGYTLADLEFQAGSYADHGVNGLTNEILIDIVAVRIAKLNEQLPCSENDEAIEGLAIAASALHSRTERRKLEIETAGA